MLKSLRGQFQFKINRKNKLIFSLGFSTKSQANKKKQLPTKQYNIKQLLTKYLLVFVTFNCQIM